MKYTNLIMFLSFAIFSHAQHTLLFESKIYFEDAVGNKDTIEIGYDTIANSRFNPQLGEIDLKNKFNDELEVRACHSLDWGRNSSQCVLSKRIIGSCEKIIDLLDPLNICFAGDGIIFFIKAKHQPVKISWNRKEYEDNVKSCMGSSFFITDYTYHVTDPLNWLKSARKRFACASKQDQFIVNMDKNYIDTAYSQEYTFSTTRKFLNGPEETILGVEFNFDYSNDFSPCQLISETENQKNRKHLFKFENVYPNPTQDYLLINNSTSNPISIVQIFNQNGQLAKTYNQITNFEKAFKISIEDLNSGFYLIQISYSDKSIGFRKFVKM